MASRTTICSSAMLWGLTRPGIKGWYRGKIRCRGPHPLERGRELLKRLTDVIISPGSGNVAVPTITGVNPDHAPHNVPTQVVISGSGFSNTQTVRFGTAVAQFTLHSDGQLTATTPNVPAPIDVPLTVTTKGGSATF